MAKGNVGQIIVARDVKNIQVRRNGPTKLVRIQIEREDEAEDRVLPDSGVEEVLATATAGLSLEEIESHTLLAKPEMVEDGVTFKFSRKLKPVLARMNIECLAWNGETS
jgi:hypothetical protein